MRKHLTILLISTNLIFGSDFVSKEKMKTELLIILENLKQYKNKNEKEIKLLRLEIENMKKNFHKYKKKKSKEIQTYRHKLIKKEKLFQTRLQKKQNIVFSSKKNQRQLQQNYQRVLKENQALHNKITRLRKNQTQSHVQMKKKFLREIAIKDKIIKEKTLKYREMKKKQKIKNKPIVKHKIITKEKVITKQKVIKKKRVKVYTKAKIKSEKKKKPSYQKKPIVKTVTPQYQKRVTTYLKPIQTRQALPKRKKLPWVEIVVDDNADIYELALRYYGDRSKYSQIYVANSNIIGKNLKIYNGMSLKIPMTIEFDEQPIILNAR